jgi:hypothetical protein
MADLGNILKVIEYIEERFGLDLMVFVSKNRSGNIHSI